MGESGLELTLRPLDASRDARPPRNIVMISSGLCCAAVEPCRGENMLSHPATFHLIMIKPAHYDDNGYPIQWLLSAMPSNTLTCLNGLAEDCRKREVLGPGTNLVIATFDETNQRIRPDRILKSIKPGDKALVC